MTASNSGLTRAGVRRKCGGSAEKCGKSRPRAGTNQFRGNIRTFPHSFRTRQSSKYGAFRTIRTIRTLRNGETTPSGRDLSAAELLTIAAKEGVRLVLNGDRLIWEADHQPPADLLASIKAHRLELIEALSAANESVQPQYIIQTAATASPEWIAARDHHIGHLMTCRACYAPTGRYCASGADLRQRYDTITEAQAHD